jgi:hypothetical protein
MITPEMIWAAAEVIRFSPDGLGATELARLALEAAERAAVSEEPVAWMHPDANWTSRDRSVVAMHCQISGPHPVPLYTRPLPSLPEAPGKKGEVR